MIKLFLTLFFLAFIATVFTPVDNAEWAGCAIDSCPQSLQDYYYKHGGLPYYAKFPKDSKEYWHAYCTQFPDGCIY